MTQITDHLANIERRVAVALSRSNRPDERILLLAASKGQPVEAIVSAYSAGQRHFGESYLQEALPKLAELGDRAIEWHFIGRIQSNKTKAIAENFGWVHTVDRARVAERLGAQRPHHAPPLNVLIQLNLDSEQQKGGVDERSLTELAAVVASLPRLRLRGLMTIPQAGQADEQLRRHFLRVHSLWQDLKVGADHVDTLSMGMSEDFESAIECGSTCIRIGTAIFGPRSRKPA